MAGVKNSEVAEIWEVEAAIRELTRRVIELSSCLQIVESHVIARKKPKPSPKKPPPAIPKNRAGIARPKSKLTRQAIPKIPKPPKPLMDFSGEDELFD